MLCRAGPTGFCVIGIAIVYLEALNMGTISGPFDVTLDGYNPQGGWTYKERRLKYKQVPRDSNKPLPYKALFIKATYLAWLDSNIAITASGSGWLANNAFNGGISDFNGASNRAYEKLISKMHKSVSLGMALAERAEAVSMITKRAETLANAYRALRKGQFRKFLTLLDVPPKKKHRGLVQVRSKQASGLWLEYWFGWSPFVQDIYDGIQLIDSPYPASRVTGVGVENLTGQNRFQPYNMTAIVKCGAYVEVDNEMLYRANQFGVSNPALIAWELVPFSFLVDWFIPVGNYLRSSTDFVGLSIRDPYTTKYLKGSGNYCGYWGEVLASADATYVERSQGLPGPVVTLDLPNGLSITRGATAISLVIALFLNDRK
jgi:hypothetical protein